MTVKNASKVGPRYPQVVVLVGATGDLARRKLLPGLFHLCSSGFIPGCRIIGVSLDELDAGGFRAAARSAPECRRLHYLSVPPSAALSVVRMLGAADLVERSHIVMEKPFGTDLASA